MILYIDCEIWQVEAEIAAVENSRSAFSEEEESVHLMALHKKLNELVQKCHKKRRETAQA